MSFVLLLSLSKSTFVPVASTIVSPLVTVSENSLFKVYVKLSTSPFVVSILPEYTIPLLSVLSIAGTSPSKST